MKYRDILEVLTTLQLNLELYKTNSDFIVVSTDHLSDKQLDLFDYWLDLEISALTN